MGQLLSGKNRQDSWVPSPCLGGGKVKQPCEILGRATTGHFYHGREVGGVELGLKVAEQLKLIWGAELGVLGRVC